MNLHALKKSIKAKLLIPIALALFACISGLILVIIVVQGNFQKEMIESTTTLLHSSQDSANSKLGKLNADIEHSLAKLAETAGQRLSETTEEKLSKEKDTVALSYQEGLRENAMTIAKLIAKVAPASILSHDYTALIGLSRAVSASENIIFAIFKDADGKFLTRYVNRNDPMVKGFIAKGEGRKKIDKLLHAAANDETVFLHEQAIDLEGQMLGKIILCINKTMVKERIDEMNSRFGSLVNTNCQMVSTTLINESDKVKEKLDKAMDALKEEGETSTIATAENITNFNQRINDTTRNIILTGGTICIAFVFFVLFFMVSRVISTPLDQSVAFANQIAQGDISKEITVSSDDEIGTLTKALATMRNNLYTIISEIHSGVTTLDSSAHDMSSVSSQLTTSLKTTASRSRTVTTAAEQMSSNSHSVASAVEQASTNTGTVAANVNDISKSLADMAYAAQQAKEETASAVNKIESSSTQVDKLSEASQEIGSIAETISTISDKINLLALNATIEAARAGEAGKGFAVVAHEVKELAKQSGAATTNIAEKLKLTQNLTTVTVNEIKDISGAINRIDDSVGAITTAISQQDQSASEILGSISQTADGLQEVNENVSQLTTAADQVAKEISEVSAVNTEMNHSSTQVHHDANDLKDLAVLLKGMTRKFTL